jgi:hypothetical protein
MADGRVIFLGLVPPLRPPTIGCAWGDKSKTREGMSSIGKAISSVIIILVTCAACSSSSPPSFPTEDDGKALLAQKLDRIFLPPFSIDSFSRTKGESKTESGVEVYQMKFTALVKYTGNEIRCIFPQCPQLSGADLQAAFDRPHKSITITGSLSFEKTQGGWVGLL